MNRSMLEVLSNIWHDPVWSKVIAAIILIILSYIAGVFKKIKNLINHLIKKYKKNNYPNADSEQNNDQKDKIKQNTIPDNIINPPVFFSNRIADAFPGLRGIAHFDSPRKAIKRLEILLGYPLQWEYESNSEGHIKTDPVWWYRGDRDMYIESFKKLNWNTFQINNYRLKLNKIIAYSDRTYQEHFVYVECDGEKQIGINNISESDIANDIKNYGFSKEEYGLLNNKPIKRSEYDDGSAVISGKVVNASHSILQIRFLSKFNFIISSKSSPYNSQLFRKLSLPYFNDIVIGKISFSDFMDFVNKFNKKYGKDIIEENNHRINIPMQKDYYKSK